MLPRLPRAQGVEPQARIVGFGQQQALGVTARLIAMGAVSGMARRNDGQATPAANDPPLSNSSGLHAAGVDEEVVELRWAAYRGEAERDLRVAE